MNEKIFNRVEKKYLITKDDYSALTNLINQNLRQDDYYKSEIYNLYYDTDNFDFIINSIEHPDFKQKLRARSYAGYDKVFLEIKTKILGRAIRIGELEDTDLDGSNNLGYKRRVLLTRSEYDLLRSGKTTCEALAAANPESASEPQIAREVDYFITRFHQTPKILVYYNRESYRDDHGLRITFDSGLHYRDKNLDFVKNARDPALFDTAKDAKCIIMEIKAENALPLWLVHELGKRHIYPQRFSKIGNIYERIKNVQ